MRIKKIVNLIDNDFSVCDVGCDHAKLLIELRKKGNNSKLIGTEVANGPYNIAKKAVEGYNIEIYIGDGLKPLKQEVDVVVIAGMGGELISNIIEDSIDLVRKSKLVILQPMQKIEYLRNYMYLNNFKLIDELISSSRHLFFNILVYKNGKDEEYDFILGKGIYDDQNLYHEYLKYLERKYRSRLDKIPKKHCNRDEILDIIDRVQTRLGNRIR